MARRNDAHLRTTSVHHDLPSSASACEVQVVQGASRGKGRARRVVDIAKYGTSTRLLRNHSPGELLSSEPDLSAFGCGLSWRSSC